MVKWEDNRSILGGSFRKMQIINDTSINLLKLTNFLI
jgi:hypothetical protein